MIKQKGKIGIFDSGLGGLTILKEVIKLIPHYEYIYLADNLNIPYGDKSRSEIFKLTLNGVEWLFKNNAEIVILACNTASANALQKIQQEILPIKYPNKKVLGIIVPTIEEIKTYIQKGCIGILATKATIESRVYEIEIKRNPKIKIFSQTGGKLVTLIEHNNKTEILAELEYITKELFSKNEIGTVILGCTHYALIIKEITQIFPKHVRIILQGELVAKKLLNYLNRHPEISGKLNNSHSLSFNTTSNSKQVKQLMKHFYGKDILVATVNIKPMINKAYSKKPPKLSSFLQ